MNYVDCFIMCIYVWLNIKLFYKRIVTYSKRVTIPYKQGGLSHIKNYLVKGDLQ